SCKGRAFRVSACNYQPSARFPHRSTLWIFKLTHYPFGRLLDKQKPDDCITFSVPLERSLQHGAKPPFNRLIPDRFPLLVYNPQHPTIQLAGFTQSCAGRVMSAGESDFDHFQLSSKIARSIFAANCSKRNSLKILSFSSPASTHARASASASLRV